MFFKANDTATDKPHDAVKARNMPQDVTVTKIANTANTRSDAATNAADIDALEVYDLVYILKRK